MHATCVSLRTGAGFERSRHASTGLQANAYSTGTGPSIDVLSGNTGSASVILAHNHTSGIAVPSNEDIATTRLIGAALRAVGVVLADHIITADGDFISMADSGYLEGI